ncbi:MAG: response regulator [Deltaproteobacteria bacterium]|nr:response regulator [Deltaproteobacteria bacterium]
MMKKRILVVDDNEFFIQQEISCLGRDRFYFYSARCGREALEMARNLLPDLILLDHIMPDLTGPEVCRHLKNDPLTSSIPVVIVSSGSRESSGIGTIMALCDGLIHKPIRNDLLVTIVEELLDLGERRLERVSLSLPCTISRDNVGMSANVLSLSAEGVFVDMAPLPIPGDVFEIRFALPSRERAVYVRSAAVVWTGRLKETGPKGAGMRFLTIDPVDKGSIHDYVRLILEVNGFEGAPCLTESFPL